MSQQVFVFDPSQVDEKSRVRGVGRYLQILKENFPKWTFTSDVSSIIREPGDVVFLNPFFNPFQPPPLSKKIFSRQILVIHDVIPLKYPSHFPSGLKGKLHFLANKKTLGIYDHIITDSMGSKSDIKEKLNLTEDKIKVIFPCLPKIFTSKSIKLSKVDQIEDSDIPDNYFIYVGDATWNKNLVNLAKAIKQVDATCVFVGQVFSQIHKLTSPENPWQRELVEFFQMAKGDPRFIFPGFVTDGTLVELYKNALANLLVSRDEGFGFSYLEASSQETPSLLGNIPVLHEVSQDAALFVDEEDPNKIAQKLKALLENEDLRETLGQESLERSRFFSSEQFRNALDKVITGRL